MSPEESAQPDQASGPSSARIFSATDICSLRLARSGRSAYCSPPYCCQVSSVICRPPKNPLPVFELHRPPLSHMATAFHVLPASAALAPLAAKRGSVRPAPVAATATIAVGA